MMMVWWLFAESGHVCKVLSLTPSGCNFFFGAKRLKQEWRKTKLTVAIQCQQMNRQHGLRTKTGFRGQNKIKPLTYHLSGYKLV